MTFWTPRAGAIVGSTVGATARVLALAALLAPPLTYAATAVPPAPAPPQAHAQTLVPAASQITFVARQLGVPLQGRFKRFAAQLAFDPHRPAASTIALQIDLGSVSLNEDADAELLKADWFDTARFPRALFQSSAIRALGAGRYEVAGRLTIKGVTRELRVPVQITQAAGLSTATGGFDLQRLDFKVGDGEWADPSVVANPVRVQFKLVLQGLAPL